jgi:hypothetical protein
MKLGTLYVYIRTFNKKKLTYLKFKFNEVGLTVFTMVVMKNSVLWDISLCSLLKVNRHFREHITSACRLLHAGFLLGLFFDPEDGGDMFL